MLEPPFRPLPIDPHVDPFGYRCSIEWQGDPLLQTAYSSSFDCYLAYRRELRSQVPNAGELLSVEAKTRTAWILNPDLRAEFGGSYAACLAYYKAEAEGRVRIIGESVAQIRRLAR